MDKFIRNILDNARTVVLAVLIVFILIGSSIYVLKYPDDFNALSQFLLNILLAFLSILLGLFFQNDTASKKAGDRWLPQASSVIQRLMTLQENVLRFSSAKKQNCSGEISHLPELSQTEFEKVRLWIQLDCQNSSERFHDVAVQLGDSILDWQRFVAENCNDEEYCKKLFEEWERPPASSTAIGGMR